MQSFLRRLSSIVLGVVLLTFLGSSELVAQTTPTTISFQSKLATRLGGLVAGRHTVWVKILDGDNVKWQGVFPNTLFTDGVFSLVLGLNNSDPGANFDLGQGTSNDTIPVSAFESTNPRFGLSITGPNTGFVFFPIPSTPYAAQARIAERVVSVDASVISGTFTSTINATNDLVVGSDTLFVNADANRVSIGKTSADFKLDVNGVINAQGFRVGGEELESVLSWKRVNNTVFYDEGLVGVGTSAPTVELDVAGTLNASEIRINNRLLSEVLQTEFAWQDGPGNDIFFDGDPISNQGNVGIGLTDPQEKLDVNGAIRIGESLRVPPLAGTIQFNSELEDFQGFDGTSFRSLTGISGDGNVGEVTFWTGTKTIDGDPNLVWDNVDKFLGIGLSDATPSARLDVRGSSTNTSNIVRITNSAGTPLFVVNDTGLGIGTSAPSADLHVEGTIDADNFTINGDPIELALNTSSFWLRANPGTEDDRIFYDFGNVGIGTSTPRSLLELASTTGNPSITFDIGGNDLFTMGISTTNTDAFIISRGGDLEQPVFVFEGENIGVGTTTPSANLHVSGDSGVVFTGTFGAGEDLPLRGPGAKLIWYPKKAAFRAGRATFNEWDNENIGEFSVALGENPSANGRGATIAGGSRNEAAGEFSVVAGGQENLAGGSYSFAAGRQAAARHAGAFVWADNTPSLNNFSSTLANQFLIRAHNGVGINTNDTSGAALTIAHNSDQRFLFRALNNQGNAAFVINASGNVGVGTTQPGTTQLAVANGPMGIGTTQPRATLEILNPRSDEFLMILGSDTASTPAMTVTTSGNVGIGFNLDHDFLDVSGNPVVFDVNGPITGKRFFIETEDGPVELTPNPGSPWAQPLPANGSSTFFNLGNVGIGTPSPNSLLELSNRNVSGNHPVITFDISDINGVSQGSYSMSITRNAADNAFVFVIDEGNTISSSPGFIISTDNIGIGLGLGTPQARLHVSGNTLISGNAAINTPVTDNFRLSVVGGVNTDRLFIGGNLFTPLESPWGTQGDNIFFITGNVGIGTSNPTQRLEVKGTVSVNNLAISGPLSLGGLLTVNDLRLQDIASPDALGILRVNTGRLEYQNPSGQVQIISSPLQKGDGDDGKLSYFVNDSTLGETDIFYRETNPRLLVSGNFVVSRNFRNGGFRVGSSVDVGGTDALTITSELSHTGSLDDIKSYAGQKIDVDILNNWGNNSGSVIEVLGMDITMQSDPSSVQLINSEAIGLRVDVSSVNVSGGNKAAAVFLGGNVGIGTTQPSAELEVNGTVSANFFNLSGGLNVPELTINNDALVARSVLEGSVFSPRVGIGITNPQDFDAELFVSGSVSANNLIIKGGISSTTLNINSGALFVDSQGRIGIGTTEPNGQIEIRRVVTSSVEAYTGESIALTIDGAGPSTIFFLNKDLVGMDVKLSSQQFNILDANAVGLNIDLSDLSMNTDSLATGIQVDVAGNTGTRYAAIFNGGNVGIGTTQPSADLHVSGNIIADNLNLQNTLSAGQAEFNFLTVNQSATFNGTVTVNRLVVLESLTANALALENNLVAQEAVFSTLNASVASINSLLRAFQLESDSSITARTGSFSGGVGIGVAPPATGLTVSGNVQADRVAVSGELSLTTATLNINNGRLFVSSTNDRVGIGTLNPDSTLHISQEGDTTFFANNNFSWNALRIQNRNNSALTAAGLLLVPDGAEPSRNVGSGIVALRSTGTASTPGSHLVFITDPEIGLPAERMRISESGFVGIGTQAPTSLLHVDGNGLFTGDVTVNGTLSFDTLNSAGGITINARGIAAIDGTASINANLLLGSGLFFREGTQPTGVAGFGSLFVDSSDNNLYYLEPGSTTPINISSAFTGDPTRVPFFDLNGNLSDVASLFWDNDAKRFQVGTANEVSVVSFGTTLNAATSGNVAAQRIIMNFEDRTAIPAPAASVFSGLDITFGSRTPNDPQNFGRLANGETAIGLRVDVSSLRARQFALDGSGLSGFKYSAAFLGGGVGVGTTQPDAALHVVSTTAGNVPFIVDLAGTANALVVDDSGFVGVGTNTPASKLTVKAPTAVAGDSAFQVLNSSNDVLLFVQNNGLTGIGTNSPQATLDVVGDVSANSASLGGITGTTLNIGTNALFVNASGNVGIGTSTPSGNITFFKQFDTPTDLGSAYTSQKIDLILGKVEPGTSFTFNQDITGLDVNLSSSAGSTLGDANPVTTTVNAVGVSVNLSGLTLASDATATGLFVDVTGDGGTRYAAIFNGGNVGIGTSNPTVALAVSGDIIAQGLSLSGSLSASAATFNTLFVTSEAFLNGDVSVNNLTARTVSANNVIMSGTLTVATGSFTTLNVTQFGSFDSLGIGVANPTLPLEISGNASITGDLTLRGTLAVSTINALNSNLIVSPNGTLTVQGDVTVNGDLQVDEGLFLTRLAANPPTDNARGLIFVDTSGDLRFHNPNTNVLSNLSAAFTGVSGRIPYFDVNRSLSASANLFWDDTSNTFQVGTDNIISTIEVLTTLNNTASGNISAQRIRLNVQDRTALLAAPASTFSGLDITFQGANRNNQESFGRLASGETAIGLNVDVSSLRAKQFDTDGAPVQGQKYSAVFLGGSVGVGTTRPAAGLHVVSPVGGNTAFRVDSSTLTNALVVDEDGLVGISTANPTSKLSVVAANALNTGSAFHVIDSASSSLLFVRNDGRVGIGTNSPDATLDVNGTVSANATSFASVQATTLNIGNNAFLVDASGNIGIGTTLSSGNITFFKQFDTPSELTSAFTSQKINLTLGEVQSGTTFAFDQDITGLDVVLSTAAGSRLGDNNNGTPTVNAVGVSVNMSQFDLAADARAIGLDVDVTGTGGTRFAALFNGGNVGIGTSNPTVALDVSGDIRAVGLVLTGSLDASNATFNSLVVTGVASFNSTVSVNTLTAATVSTNHLVVTDLLSIATANVTTIDATAFASFGSLGLGVVSPPTIALEISGNAFITGNASITGTLTVPTISASGNIAITTNGTLIVNGDVSANTNVLLGGALHLAQRATNPTALANQGLLFVDNSGHLNYFTPGGADPVRITEALIGTPTRIPFYDNTQNLSSSANLFWDAAATKFTVGTANALTTVEVVNTINAQASGNLTAHSIRMAFEDRGALPAPLVNPEFKGLSIALTGTNPADPFNFGRLGNNETAVGLDVDVRNVRARFTTEETPGNESRFSGFKYAAIFRGGSVGVGTNSPLAALHVVSEVEGNFAMRVDTPTTSNALVVDKDGFVGIGTSQPNASLGIKSLSNTSPVVAIDDRNSSRLLTLLDNGNFGIGLVTPDATLHVTGNTPLRVVAQGASDPSILVNSDGLVGINTALPSANLHIIAKANEAAFNVGTNVNNPNALTVASNGFVGVGVANPAFNLHVDGVVLTGTPNQGVTFDNLPSFINTPGDDTRGFLASRDDDNLFVGVREVVAGESEALIHWGNTPTDNLIFQHFIDATGASTNVMAIRGDGKVGIGTLVPSASLHIVTSGMTLRVGSTNTPNSLVASSSGFVGIGTSLPSANLHVDGTMMSDFLEITEGTVDISTLNVNGTMIVNRTATQNEVATAHYISLIVSADITNDITGLDINMESVFDPDFNQPGLTKRFSLFGEARAYGIKVDMTNVEVRDASLSSRPGHKFSAVFLGGGVGIGTTRPELALHVEGDLVSDGNNGLVGDIARFGSSRSDLTVRDHDLGRIGFFVRNRGDLIPFQTLTLVPGAAGGDASGRVGIGTTQPDKTLVVNGDVRVGIVQDLGAGTAATGNGNALFFSGGPDVSATNGFDSENKDPIWMARNNFAANESELLVNIGGTETAGDPNNLFGAEDKFLVGWTQGGAPGGVFHSVLDVRMNGRTRISDGVVADFDPEATLHIRANKTGVANVLSNHVMVVENAGGADADGLAIYHSGINAGATLDTDSHFITFMGATNVLGAITGNGDGSSGVRFLSTGADYAEYLPKSDVKEGIEYGDIVGVVNGYISKDTSTSQQVLVRSTAASVAGNWPGEEEVDNYELIAFFGQVPVRVRGKVELGDFIIPSGLNDGTGIAVSPSDIRDYDMAKIVGRAWEESSDKGVKLIKTAVGFNFSIPQLHDELKTLRKLEKDIADIKASQDEILKDFESKFEAQSREIEALMKKIEN